jgi:hypothetical protein
LHGETFDGNAYVASQSRVKIMLTALDAHHVAAEVFNFKSLMIVMLAAFIVPILVSRGKRIAVPIVVGELVAGIIIGPSVLGWVVVEGQAMEFPSS